MASPGPNVAGNPTSSWRITKSDVMQRAGLTEVQYTNLRVQTMDMCKKYLDSSFRARTDSDKQKARQIVAHTDLSRDWERIFTSNGLSTTDILIFWPAWLSYCNGQIPAADRPSQLLPLPTTSQPPSQNQLNAHNLQDVANDDAGPVGALSDYADRLSIHGQSTGLKWNNVTVEVLLSEVDRSMTPIRMSAISTMTDAQYNDLHIRDEDLIQTRLVNFDKIQKNIKDIAPRKFRDIQNFELDEWGLFHIDAEGVMHEITIQFELEHVLSVWLTDAAHGRPQARFTFVLLLKNTSATLTGPPPNLGTGTAALVAPSNATTSKRPLPQPSSDDDHNDGEDDGDNDGDDDRATKRIRRDDPDDQEPCGPVHPVQGQGAAEPVDPGHQPSSPTHVNTSGPDDMVIDLVDDDSSEVLQKAAPGPDEWTREGDDDAPNDEGVMLGKQALTPDEFDRYIAWTATTEDDMALELALDASKEELYDATQNTRIAEHIDPAYAKQLREFNQLTGGALHALSEDDKLPAPGTNRTCTPGQAYTMLWAKDNERKVGGGVISHQMGFGKTHTALVHATFMRAYVNRLWDDWDDDEEKHANTSDWARRHHPQPGEVEDDTTLSQRGKCPTSDKWEVQCPCELGYTYHHYKYQPGWTLIVPPARSIKDPWLDEFFAMTDSVGGYQNNGFGKKDGFIKDDNKPFRVIALHTSSTTGPNGAKCKVQTNDDGMLNLEEADGKVLQSVQYSDRLIVITSHESYEGTPWRSVKRQVPVETTGRKGVWSRSRTQEDVSRLIPAVIAIDEAHEYKTAASSAPAVVKKILAKVRSNTNNGWRVDTVPVLFTLTGTPWVRDVWIDFGLIWIPLWREISSLNQNDWSQADDDDRPLRHFTDTSIKSQAVLSAELYRESAVLDQALKDIAKQHKRNTVRIVRWFQIKFDEQTRFWGRKVIKLPNVTKERVSCPMTNRQIDMINDPLERSLARVRRRVAALHRDWVNSNRRGVEPTLLNQYFKEAHNLPLTKTVINFPWISEVFELHRRQHQTHNEAHDPVIPGQNMRYSDLSDEAKRDFDSLKLTAQEIGDKRWYQRDHIQESPYYIWRRELWAQSHKGAAIKRWVDKVWKSRSQVYMGKDAQGKDTNTGRQVKGIIMTDSPATAMILFSYIEYEIMGGKGLCALSVGSTPMNTRTAIYDWHQDRATPKGKEYAGLSAPIILIATQGIFGTGQNMARASRMLLVEPSPSATKELQTPARIQRKGGLETVEVTTLFSKTCKYETILQAKIQKSLSSLAEIVACKVEDLAQLNDTLRQRRSQSPPMVAGPSGSASGGGLVNEDDGDERRCDDDDQNIDDLLNGDQEEVD